MKTSPKYGWPIAQDTDPVKQYPTAVDDPFKMKLETDLDKVGRHTSGQGTSGLPSGVPGYATVAVTFPAGRFTAAPIVTVSPVAATAAKGYAWPQTPTTSGVTLVWQQEAGSARATVLYWHATQAASGGLLRADLEDQGPTREVVVTCPTVGCENRGVPVTLTVAPDVEKFQCGPCGATLTPA